MEARISQIEVDGEKLYTVIIRDITLRKRAEAGDELLVRERAARAEPETANRAKDSFLATVSHELRTPLSPILAWSRVLREGKVDEEKTRRALDVIERSARTQAQLIEDMLDVSRIVSGKLRMQVRPVLIRPVIEAAVDTVRPAAEAKNVRLLGLAIVKHILEAHGGTIHAESPGDGKGAVFTVQASPCGRADGRRAGAPSSHGG